MDSDDEAQDIRYTQLDAAARDGDLARCKAIIDEWKKQLSPSSITSQHLAAAFGAAVGSKHTDMAAYLLEQGAVVSGYDMVLALGETEDAINMFQTFLDHGWDINSKTNRGNTMLKHIVRDEKLIRWFLAHGADPNAYGQPGSTILDVAAANSTPTVLDLLIAHGARLEDSDALHSAAGEREKKPGRVEMMSHLLHLGMDINALAQREYPAGRRIGRGTPLQAAVAPEEPDRIQFLIEHGANQEVKNTLGQTPLEYAIERGFTTSEAILRGAMGNPRKKE